MRIDSKLSFHWSARKRSRPSLTRLPKDVALFCLTFLSDRDLYRSANTCSLFYKAFFTLTKTGGKSASQRLVNLAHCGHKFPRVKMLNLRMPPSDLSVLLSIDSQKFPALRVVRICYICVQLLPQHQGVTALHMIGGEYDTTQKFPYQNLRFLRIENSDFSPYSALPQLLNLTTLQLSSCVVSHKITTRRFPKLRNLEIKGYNEQPILCLPGLEELILNVPQQLHTQPQRNLRRLKVITGGDIAFLGRIIENMYPRLEKLEIDLGIR